MTSKKVHTKIIETSDSRTGKEGNKKTGIMVDGTQTVTLKNIGKPSCQFHNELDLNMKSNRKQMHIINSETL